MPNARQNSLQEPLLPSPAESGAQMFSRQVLRWIHLDPETGQSLSESLEVNKSQALPRERAAGPLELATLRHLEVKRSANSHATPRVSGRFSTRRQEAWQLMWTSPCPGEALTTREALAALSGKVPTHSRHVRPIASFSGTVARLAAVSQHAACAGGLMRAAECFGAPKPSTTTQKVEET